MHRQLFKRILLNAASDNYHEFTGASELANILVGSPYPVRYYDIIDLSMSIYVASLKTIVILICGNM